MNIQGNNIIVAAANVPTIFKIDAIFGMNGAMQSIADVRQETQICASFDLNPYLRAHDIKAFVHDGTATLTGFVPEGVNKELAKVIALAVNGVTLVDNQIIVDSESDATSSYVERSQGEMVDDANITAAIKSKLMLSQYGNGLSTDVDTARGKVSLTGTVDSEQARDLAGRLASNTHGVTSVDNLLEVSLSRSVLERNSMIAATVKARDIADSWISTKVRSTFLYSSNINSHDIVVSTRDGIVTLAGKAGSIIERAFAIELAQRVRGVKGVFSDTLHC